MPDLFNYYQVTTERKDHSIPERYPSNHVSFSPLLAPLKWISGMYELFGKRAYTLEKDMLQEFDKSSPIEKYIGEQKDLSDMRNLLISYCRGIDNNPHLSAIGRFLIKKIGIDALKNRRKVLQFYNENRDFINKNGSFKSPVIIAGSPRSGTTLLHRLLSEDPNSRSPYTFELELPLPPLKMEEDPLKDQRIKKSAAAIKTLTQLAPGFMEKLFESHLWSATEFEESIDYTLSHNGITQMNCPLAGRSHTKDIFNVADKRSLFLYEKLFFATLDAFRPAKSHWVLKATEYARYFPLIFSEYEDARVVLTHRNPLITLPSLCRLWESWCIAFDKNGSFDKHQFGQIIKLIQEQYLTVPMNFRSKNPQFEKQIMDCMYEELFSDPIEMVKKIYKKFDLEYTDEFEKRMIVYLKNNQQGKYGRHKYSLEEYGFEADQVLEDLSDYRNHYSYNIPEQKDRPQSFDFLSNYSSNQTSRK